MDQAAAPSIMRTTTAHAARMAPPRRRGAVVTLQLQEQRGWAPGK